MYNNIKGCDYMGSPRIIVLYKNGMYKVLKESKVKSEILNEKIKCLLVPKISNPTVYYPILPSKILTSSKFNTEITFDIGEFDFENNHFEFIDRFTSKNESDSLIGFINYLSVFYLNEGIATVLEDGFLSDTYWYGYRYRAIYPINYKIKVDKHLDSIYSDELRHKDISCELNIHSTEWIFSDRMRELSDILYTSDSKKNSLLKLPRFISLTEEYWTSFNHINNKKSMKDNNDLILVKIGDIPAYRLLTYKDCIKLMHIPSYNFNFFLVDPDNISGNIYRAFTEDIDNMEDVVRDGLSSYLYAENCSEYQYMFSLADIYCLLIWAEFSKDIVNYVMALYSKSIYKPLLLARHVGKMVNTTFTYKDFTEDVFTAHLIKYIRRYMK